ncbi:MAG: GatB/YqeY domain-containing protein [Candidatus Omnitrophica bacterium]|nr:GatB/YqeY domain-containing protein [Candidatus Omnitrophota bacterium]MCM8831325.1 GatB/YqeY domain-containing protein [Candidatus Omnitrophota bacterium]
MGLEEKIYKDYVEALKKGEKEKATFLNFIRAELKNYALKINKNSLDDSQIIGQLKKLKKQLQDAKELAVTSKNSDFIIKTEREIKILNQYLPEELSDGEVLAIIQEVIREVSATSIKDMGRVMKVVLEKINNRADAKLVSDLVKKQLSS